MLIRRVILCMLAFVILLPYQNCSFTGDGYTSNQTRNGSGLASNSPSIQIGGQSGGQPYDGKPYVLSGACADGTIVKSRLIMNGKNGAVLYRDNCDSENPKTVSASAITFNSTNPDQLTYNGGSYVAELPAIPLPGLVPWYYQLQGSLQSRPASIYILDMFDTSAAQIQNLKMAGHTVICMISAGTVENWRPDAASFPSSAVGRQVNGANDEKWLDTRNSTVRSTMRARLDMAKSKGCHGVNFDSVDGYDNNTGFPLSRNTQLEYNFYLAQAAHDRALILSLNNVPDLAADLSIPFDFAIAEQCFQYGECDKYSAFVQRGKPVLAAEYTSFSQAQCNQAASLQLSLSFFNSALDGTGYRSCF